MAIPKCFKNDLPGVGIRHFTDIWPPTASESTQCTEVGPREGSMGPLHPRRRASGPLPGGVGAHRPAQRAQNGARTARPEGGPRRGCDCNNGPAKHNGHTAARHNTCLLPTKRWNMKKKIKIGAHGAPSCVGRTNERRAEIGGAQKGRCTYISMSSCFSSTYSRQLADFCNT